MNRFLTVSGCAFLIILALAAIISNKQAKLDKDIEQRTMTQVAAISPQCILFRFYDPDRNAHYICKTIDELAPISITYSLVIEDPKGKEVTPRTNITAPNLPGKNYRMWF
jgi:hypothetical protein